jgi:EAL domain-containing protein (putative c-di-GMP-specific phosphodiesterase class I)/CheY-like chemotaxis protein
VTREPATRRILLVDDDAEVLRACALLLEGAGFAVTAVGDGRAALAAIDANGHAGAGLGDAVVATFCAVVTDIRMEGFSGLDLLRAARERDPDLPVILMTGGPSLDTAIEAMHEGAHRYLMKPVAPAQLIETVTRAALLHDLARVKREAHSLQALWNLPAGERRILEESFTNALGRLYAVFQPIVSMAERRTIGFEALVRTHEPRMQSPGVLFETAALLQRESELSRAIYAHVAVRAPALREDLLLFVNIHPPDLLDPTLYGEGSPLAKVAHRVVLELTERASLDRLGDVGPVVRDLRRLGYRIAVDDLGTGYSGLTTFMHLSPDVVKLDRSMVTGIDRHPTKRRVVGAMYALCADLGMTVISEGVETRAERETLLALGADQLQGFLFARPTEGFIEPPLD